MADHVAEGIAGRLKEAIPTDGIRDFHRKMEERGVRGASYAMVHRYLGGEATPSLEFLTEAADVLSVRPGWLAFNEGSMRETGDDLKSWIESVTDSDERFPDIIAILGGQAGRDLFRGLVERIVHARPADTPEPSHDEVKTLAYRLAFVLLSLRAAFERSGGDTGWTTQRQIVGVLSALFQMIPPPGEGREVAHVAAALPTPPRKTQEDTDATS